MNNKFISLFLSLTIAFTVGSPIAIRGAEVSKDLTKVQAMDKLNSLSGGKLKLREKNGQVFLAGNLSTKQTPGETSALKFMDENKSIFGIDNAAKELKITNVKKDELGHTYVKLQQKINGLKVEGSLLNLHFDNKGVIVSVNGNLDKDKTITTLGNLDVTEGEAVEIAEKQFTYDSLRETPKAEKLILTKDNKNYEVYKVNIFYMEPTIENCDVYIEAHSGQVIEKESNLRYDGPVTGSGFDVGAHLKTLNLYQSGMYYQMKDVTSPATNGILTYSLNHGTTNGTLVSSTSNLFNYEDQKASVSAHYNAGQVINFYKNMFNRNSLDNKGMGINSYTHYSNNYNNAFWDGKEMIYGDGDGTQFTYLSGDLDVVGHEMTHGVISNTANLWYHNQSGALNESIADVFGVLIETYSKYNVAGGGSWVFNPSDWVIGDEVYTPKISGDALRSLSNPKLYGQPDNMSGYINYPNTSDFDNGGVHVNSGIPSKAAYNIASMVGMEETAKIYYRALTNYMSTYTDFEGARNCLVQAAGDLYGPNSVEVTDVNTAFDSVGVTEPSIDDPYEPNNTIAQAYPINIGTTYESYISSSSDDDYYKVTVNYTGSLNISLTNLPKNYDLELYNSKGDVIASSINLNLLPESINFTGTAGSSYFIRVFGNRNFSTTQKYSLLVTQKTSGVTLDKTTASIRIGDTLALHAAVSPAEASNKNVTWTSSNPSIAAVDSNGNVKATGLGSATITVATEEGGYTASCSITVLKAVTGVVLDKVQGNLQLGETVALSATVTPADAYNLKVDFKSSDESILKVDSNGLVTAVGYGSANITAITEDGGYTATFSANVKKLEIQNKNLTVNLGTSNFITYRLYPNNANDTVYYESNNQSVVKTQEGSSYLEAVGAGTATVKAYTEDGSYYDYCQVTVVKPIDHLQIDHTYENLRVGNTLNLTVHVYPEDATTKDLRWISSDNSILNVDSSGKVTAISPGSAYVTAQTIDRSKSISCQFLITQAVNGISLNKASALLKPNKEEILTVNFQPSNASNKNITWCSSNSDVASVNNGTINAHKIGTAVITAASEDGGYTAFCTVNVDNGVSNISNLRLGGKDRFDTAAAVSRSEWTTSDNVVLANAFGFADALTGVPMAYIKDAPILLTSGNVLSDSAYNEIVRLQAKNIYILGGTGVVGKNIEDSLRTKGYNVIRISGINRFETAIAIGNEVIKTSKTDTAILTTANDYPDALAISPYAAIKKYPVLYTDTKSLNPSTKDFLIRNGIKNVIIPGGEGAVSAAVANELINSGISVDRISGLNRYQTALNIVNKFKDSFNYDVVLATGEDFPDALAGGVLAARKKMPILLTGKAIDPNIANYIKGNGSITMYLLGGTGVIPDNIMSH